MEFLYRLGWHICALRPTLTNQWKADLIFRNERCILIVETGRDPQAAQITADIIGPNFVYAGYKVYYAHLNSTNRIDGIYQWFLEDHIATICI